MNPGTAKRIADVSNAVFDVGIVFGMAASVLKYIGTRNPDWLLGFVLGFVLLFAIHVQRELASIRYAIRTRRSSEQPETISLEKLKAEWMQDPDFAHGYSAYAAAEEISHQLAVWVLCQGCTSLEAVLEAMDPEEEP